jgi:hypothetical protein
LVAHRAAPRWAHHGLQGGCSLAGAAMRPRFRYSGGSVVHTAERAPVSHLDYIGFVDPSGGSADSMTLAIGHKEGDSVIVDALRERKPPFSPDLVVDEFASLLQSYRVMKVTGDRYAGEWPRERFRERGITYEPAEKPKSDLYRDLLPLINSRRVDLRDHQRLLGQLCGLERRATRAGKDSIDHAPNGHDDVANCVAGAVATLMAESSYWANGMAWVCGEEPARAEAYLQGPLYRYPFFGSPSLR